VVASGGVSAPACLSLVMADPDPLLKRQSHLPATTVLASIFGFWLFYVIIVTLRFQVMDMPSQGELASRRVIVTVIGMGITMLVWLLMRLVDDRSIGVRILVAALACVPASLIFAVVNHFFFNIYDPVSMMDVEEVRREIGSIPDFWTELIEVSLSRYFFLIAWSALYLALGYASNIQAAERQAATYARSAQLSELRALRYQLNPHFLFNTLNSLSALIMHGRGEAAEKMIINLSNFYRASLSSDQSGDVPLREEFEVQRLYLGIEEVRFPDRLMVEIDLPDDLAEWPVPGLILQPLVENAIKHGVARTTEPVTLQIAASRSGRDLILTVSDNAPVYPVEGEPGIGLANVRDRLAARFGPLATIQAGPSAVLGFSVTLTIPGPRDDD
jgi:two-component system, LytTR family, sensor kinase